MPTSGQRTSTEYQMGAGFTTPFQTSVTNPARNVFNQAAWQNQVSVNTATLNVPATSAGYYTTVSATVPLSQLPTTFTLRPTDTGAVLCSAFITPPGTTAPLLYNPPSLALAFGGGSAASQATGGAASFTLQGGRTYSAPAIVVTAQFYATTTTSQGVRVHGDPALATDRTPGRLGGRGGEVRRLNSRRTRGIDPSETERLRFTHGRGRCCVLC